MQTFPITRIVNLLVEDQQRIMSYFHAFVEIRITIVCYSYSCVTAGTTLLGRPSLLPKLFLSSLKIHNEEAINNKNGKKRPENFLFPASIAVRCSVKEDCSVEFSWLIVECLRLFPYGARSTQITKTLPSFQSSTRRYDCRVTPSLFYGYTLPIW